MESKRWNRAGKKEFRLELVDTYKTYKFLLIFVAEELGESLPKLTGDTTVEGAAFDLINWAESEHRLDELFTAFLSENPNRYSGLDITQNHCGSGDRISCNKSALPLSDQVNTSQNLWRSKHSLVKTDSVDEIMEVRHEVVVNRDLLTKLCKSHNIQELYLFGSVLRDDFGPNSDVDILVKFHPGCTPGLGFIDVQDSLSKLFNRPVDLNTPEDLSPYFRSDVLAVARQIYGEK
ncbi:MAG: nucleotidyltransferase domain-containing protein [Cyanophyceae cyanobacterium]